ncbi:MAG: hypothetical protein ACTSWG_10575 [Candidatus Helarchaeota archaeon]
MSIQQAIIIYKVFNYSFYWLEKLVNDGSISKSEAGYIVLHYGDNK